MYQVVAIQCSLFPQMPLNALLEVNLKGTGAFYITTYQEVPRVRDAAVLSWPRFVRFVEQELSPEEFDQAIREYAKTGALPTGPRAGGLGDKQLSDVLVGWDVKLFRWWVRHEKWNAEPIGDDCLFRKVTDNEGSHRRKEEAWQFERLADDHKISGVTWQSYGLPCKQSAYLSALLRMPKEDQVKWFRRETRDARIPAELFHPDAQPLAMVIYGRQTTGEYFDHRAIRDDAFYHLMARQVAKLKKVKPAYDIDALLSRIAEVNAKMS